jgi:uncharacterized C2H2 Zn-finger protein
MPQMPSKPPVVYNCVGCLYMTDNKKDYIRHLETRKHQLNDGKIVVTDKHTCSICNKIFKSRTSIYKHKAVCRGPPVVPALSTHTIHALAPADPDPASLTLDQIKHLIAENKILKELLKNAATPCHPVTCHSTPFHSV